MGADGILNIAETKRASMIRISKNHLEFFFI